MMPGDEDEQRDAARADQDYAAAADALRPLTNDRAKFPFVFKELAAYGFNRNAYGSRWVGLGVAFATIAVTLFQANALGFVKPYLDLSGIGSTHGAILVSAFVMSALWCVHFTGETVKFSGFSYAKRLWEALDQLQEKSSGAVSKHHATT